jgi:hypothetical protein
MKQLHIINGDCAAEVLRKSGVPGEILVWRDLLYEGPREPGWPKDDVSKARALFLEETTAGGLRQEEIFENLKGQYSELATVTQYDEVVLWTDACLCDQAMLCHLLTCIAWQGVQQRCSILGVEHFPGIVPFNGLGQLLPDQLASLYPTRQPVTEEQFRFAERVDKAFALQDCAAFSELANTANAPLPWIPAAAARWLKEQPDQATGLGLLEQLALEAVRSGCRTPSEIFAAVSARDTPPQYWGDLSLWAKINKMAIRKPPLVKIVGPTELLPQWDCQKTIRSYSIHPAEK